MSVSSEDDRQPLYEKPSCDPEQPSDHEQKEGLLQGFEADRERNAETKLRPRRPVIQWTISLVFLLACLAGVLFHIISLRTPIQTSAQTPAQTSEGDAEISTNDYILDPEWDNAAPPRRREYTWTVRDHIHNPDGVYRPMILVSNQFPGPLIEVNEGDTIVVHVDNQATNATSFHWHGIYQTGTPYMDGTVGITQCPIAPGHSFKYEFKVSQSGTYWWHGHQGLQSSDGLHGPLVIHGREERTMQQIPYDTDRVVLLSDHYHDLSSALLWQYLMPDMENAEPVPESGLINGRGIRNCDDFPNRRCDNSTANVGHPSFVLERNKSHRLRIINVGAFAEFSFQLDEHQLAVTEVDGTDVHPVKYHRLDISPAQRYSVVIDSNVDNADNFWLRARMITNCFTDPPKTLQPDAFAIIRYEENADARPTSSDWTEKLAQDCKDMNTTELRPVEEVSLALKPDNVFYFRSNFEIGAYRLSRGFFNGSSWRADPRQPTLQRAVNGLRRDNGNFTAPLFTGVEAPAFVNDQAFSPDRELVVQTTGVQTIDILISNFDDGAHPYHLHGYKFFVLAQGHGQPPLSQVGASVNRQTLSPLYETLDLSNPLRRDTASVEGYGWILLRVIADNPGAWALHCHVSWHAEAGLLMQFLTNTDELANIDIPRANRDLCVADGIEKGMGPKDDDYIDFAK